jgi:hypothetical protein
MNNTDLNEYKGFKVGQLLVEQLPNNRTKLVLVKGIYTDDSNDYFLGLQYVCKKSTKQNKKVTVSGKSPFWFDKI